MAREAGALIISYRRAGRVRTMQLLQHIKWTGPTYIVVSNDDEQLSQYQKLYKNLYVFDRSRVLCDYYDNMPPSGPLAVRNIAWDIASDLGWTHFVVLDDDYSHLHVYRAWARLYPSIVKNQGGVIHRVPPSWGDRLFHTMWDLLDEVPTVLSVSFSQTGDMTTKIKRKVMQTFFFRTDRRFEFVARLNDDVTTYYDLGLRGDIVLQMPALHIKQKSTQAQPGGLTEEYLRHGTYAKSMYTVLRWPAHCRVEYSKTIGRIHHRIAPYAYPVIMKDTR